MLKQYVFVPKSLKMSPGKMASQVAHSTLLTLDKIVFKQIHKDGQTLIWISDGNRWFNRE